MEQYSKRKRSINTTNEQYELYLDLMENDYIFRSGTINPTVEDGYIEKKWEELTKKLNAIGRGPALPCVTWRNRFKDWKNSTRQKYRKMKENKKKTGGGEGTNIFLTPLEERGLEAWGKIAVTGTPLVQCVGGLGQSESHNNNLTTQQNEIAFVVDDEIPPHNWYSDDPSHNTASTSSAVNDSSINNTKADLGRSASQTKAKRRKLVTPSKSLNIVGEELKASYSQTNNILKGISDSLSQFVIIYQNVNTVRNDIEKRKLELEIAKFNLENPTAQFSNNQENND